MLGPGYLRSLELNKDRRASMYAVYSLDKRDAAAFTKQVALNIAYASNALAIEAL